MDLIKQLTGKNPDEYKKVAKSLVDNSDAELFKNLVKQDEFLFDFIKNNVAKRIKEACDANNYKNLLKFFDFYSASYDEAIAEVLYKFGGIEIFSEIENIFNNGTPSSRAYAVKFFSLLPNEAIIPLAPSLRETAKSEFEPLSINSIEILAKINDTAFKDYAIEKLSSEDEFEQYNGVKYLVTMRAEEKLPDIINVMKKSSLAENIASEIPYLVPVEELVKSDDGILVLCNIVNAIPDIIPPSAVLEYNLFGILEGLYLENLTSSTAVLLRLAQDKFSMLLENEEYLFDCDKNTKEEVIAINNLLSGINSNKLKSFLYDELFDGSDFVFYAVDYVEEAEELEALLDSTNPTLILKVLSILKEKSMLKNSHKELALATVSQSELKDFIEAL